MTELDKSSQFETAILFSDIVASTALFELLGDSHARETINFCLQMMRRAVLDHNGNVIKTIGDETLSIFTNPNDAINAALQMHEDISESLTVRGRSITLRVGANFGVVTREGADISGAAVHMGARMASQAKSSQIVISQQMRDKLSSNWKASCRKLDEIKADGFSGLVEIYEVLWKNEGITSVVPVLDQATFGITSVPKRLKVSYGSTVIVVDNNNQVINIGRTLENEVSMNHDLVSRVHCRIEWNKNKFRLQDRSTNGTYVRPLRGQPVFVRRDYITLVNKGIIGLGQDVDVKSPYAIMYEILD